MTASKRLERIEVVEDRTAGSRCDEGFLRVRRLRLRNVYADGTTSRVYDCDIVSRRRVDAVAVVLYDRDEDGRVRVALRRGTRPAVALRRERDLPHAERHAWRLDEIVAGILEPEDAGEGGVEARAAAECREEAGYEVDPGDVRPLGEGLFPSPGVTDERVLFRAAATDLERGGTPPGDDSVLEEGLETRLLGLRDAIRRCRQGDVPDMKTEVALLRLADRLGYVPALDCFLDELPEEVRARAAALPSLLGE